MQIQIENSILILRFKNKQSMNELLDPLSNEYEGLLVNREGHNFPSIYIPKKNHILSKYKEQCKYVIGLYNVSGLQHELLHAKYYIDEEYRKKINDEWNNLNDEHRKRIIDFLKRLGYSDTVIIDEYQAYRYTEAPNFFGFRF